MLNLSDDDFISMEAKQLEWRILWCKAFPTLLPCHNFIDDNDCVWQSIAYDELFSTQKQKNAEAEPTFDFFSNMSLGYGEITPRAVFAIMDWIKQDDDWQAAACTNEEEANNIDGNSVVVDLGSGNGRILFAAALAFPFSKAIGLEILPELHQEALHNLDVWRERHVGTNSGNHLHSKTEFDFRCADFTKHGDLLSAAKLVFIHATVFDDNLMKKVHALCHTYCSVGTYFVMVTKPLCLSHTTEKSHNHTVIVTCAQMQLPMSWGEATLYIQRKI